MSTRLVNIDRDTPTRPAEAFAKDGMARPKENRFEAMERLRSEKAKLFLQQLVGYLTQLRNELTR